MEHEKYSYVESLRWLAARYNIEIEETETSPAQKLAQQVADSLYAINHFAMDFFSKQYWETEAGESIAQSYMQHRGFLKPIVEKFKIGYNPSDRDSLAKALLQNQFNPELFAKTGLVVERNGEWQDNYRDRIIFPIHNTTGKIIGFGARQIAKNDKSPKYINSPENDIYVKSKILYGSYFARTAIDKLNECLLVEGYTAVVSLHQAGIENVVASAFPSDQYAMETQARFHGLNPDDAIIELKPRDGEYLLRTEDILAKIYEQKDDLAIVMLGGVNYYTGQAFDMQAITKAAHEIGATAGFDLAHAAGNLQLQLHDWDVDFAVWCTYKYLNSGPGGTSGVFVNECHGNNPDLVRFAGWWGHDEKERFKMKKGFIPMQGAAGWQLSNAQIIPMAIHKASLEIIDEAGIENLRKKSILLTGYLEFILNDFSQHLTIITPKNKDERGCQLSIIVKKDGKKLFDYLQTKNIMPDWREPDVIRMSPVPLYNSFEDVYRVGEAMKEYFN